jgi:hypothetical protein
MDPLILSFVTQRLRRCLGFAPGWIGATLWRQSFACHPGHASQTQPAFLTHHCTIQINQSDASYLTVRFHLLRFYLWHMFVLKAVHHAASKMGMFGSSYYAEFSVYFFGAFAVGIIAAKMIEFPALALRDKLIPSRSGEAISTNKALNAAA